MKKTLLILGCLSFLMISCSKTLNDSVEAPDEAVVDSTAKTDHAFLLQVGDTFQPEPALLQSAEFKSQLIWENSDPTVVSVGHRGFITALHEGETIITLSYPPTGESETIKFVVGKPYDILVGCLEAGSIVLWKNGVPTTYNPGYGVTMHPISMQVQNTDIFVAGVSSQNTWPAVTFWKNGTSTYVTDPTLEKSHYTTGLAVNGTDVYVSGYDFITEECSYCSLGSSRASYWKISSGVVTQVPLNIPNHSARAENILFYGTDVFVAGSINNQYYSRACYWKNGPEDIVYLTGTDRSSSATAISIKNNAIWVIGSTECSDGSCPATAILWKNGTAIPLSDGTTDARPTCMFIDGNVIYVGGNVVKNDITVATLWTVKEGKVETRSITDGTYSAVLNGLTVSGKDIFIAGAERDRGDTFYAKYWRLYEDLQLEETVVTDLGWSFPYDSHADVIHLKPL